MNRTGGRGSAGGGAGGSSNPNRRGGDKAVDLADKKKKEALLPIGAWLLVLTGPHKGDDFRLREGKSVIGSDATCEVVLTGGDVSSRHAHIAIKREGDASATFRIIDLDSTNGTYLNDNKERITAEELVDNDVVVFGETRCKFKCVG